MRRRINGWDRLRRMFFHSGRSRWCGGGRRGAGSRRALGPGPKLIVVEPDHAACRLLASARAGNPHNRAWRSRHDHGGPCLRRAEPARLAGVGPCGDRVHVHPGRAAAVDTRCGCCAGMGIIVGRSGVAGLAAFRLASADDNARAALGLGPESRVLAFSTEGATDTPASTRRWFRGTGTWAGTGS